MPPFHVFARADFHQFGMASSDADNFAAVIAKHAIIFGIDGLSISLLQRAINKMKGIF
jgi:hypothetical protein